MTDPAEIRAKIEELVTTNGVTLEKKNKGQVMKLVMPAFKGKADMGIVNKTVGEMLV